MISNIQEQDFPKNSDICGFSGNKEQTNNNTGTGH